MMIFYVLEQVIKGTPIYVWILFLYLCKRGMSATKTAPLHLPKMLIVPIVFTLWGLDKLFTRFSQPLTYFGIYLLMGLVGIAFGYYLYEGRRSVFIKDGVFYRSGSYIPMCVMLINFSLKYILNVILSVHPEYYKSQSFETLYFVLSGISVGLFIGGFLQAYLNYKRLIPRQTSF